MDLNTCVIRYSQFWERQRIVSTGDVFADACGRARDECHLRLNIGSPVLYDY